MTRGYRLIYLAEVAPAAEVLRERGTPLARELAVALEARWADAFAGRVPVTAFKYWPTPYEAPLLAEVLGAVREGRAA